MRPALFGVTIPDGAIRVVIRPVLGPGGSQPMYEARLEVGAEPTETQVKADVARNADFWNYIDTKVKARKLEVPPEEAWSWKLRLQFYNQQSTEEVILTDGNHEFYRGVMQPVSADGSIEARVSLLHEKALGVLELVGKTALETLAAASKASCEAIAAASKASSESIAESSKAGAAAVAEATKQTAVVSQLALGQQDEAAELKAALFAELKKRAEPAKPAQTTAQQLKDLLDVGKTFMGLADGWAGAKESTPPPAGAK